MRRCMVPSGQTTHFMEPVWISEIKTLTDPDSGINEVNFIISRINIILKWILRIDTSYNKRYYTWTTSTGMNDYYSKVGGYNIDITLMYTLLEQPSDEITDILGTNNIGTVTIIENSSSGTNYFAKVGQCLGGCVKTTSPSRATCRQTRGSSTTWSRTPPTTSSTWRRSSSPSTMETGRSWRWQPEKLQQGSQ